MSQATEVVRTACVLDCPDNCGLEVSVADGKVVELNGVNDNPITGGFICRKVHRFPEHMYGPERLTTPARRIGSKGNAQFAPISWDEALSEIVERIGGIRQEFGAEAILPFCYGGSNGLLTQNTTDARLFRRLGASRLARTVCGSATGRAAEGLYGKMGGVAFDDYVHAKLIVVWGANPHASGIHLVPFLRQAQKAGAKLVVVDPRRTPLARQADLHLQVFPGGDLAIALCVIRELFASGAADDGFLQEHVADVDELHSRAQPWTFERAAEQARVPESDLRRFAEMYAQTNPAVIRCGWGLERNRHGGSAVAAVLALPAVAGKFKVRGGGYTMSNGGVWGLNADVAARAAEPSTRIVNMNQLGTALSEQTTPPVKMLFVYNANPLATLPNQNLVREGLSRDDLFTVVFDQVMTDTARYADIVLPATTFLEHSDTKASYGTMYLFGGQPAVDPVGEARPNYSVFADLCQRLDLAEPDDKSDPQELLNEIVSASPQAESLRQQLDHSAVARPSCSPNPVQFIDVFPGTVDRRVHLVPAALDSEAAGSLYRYKDEDGNQEFPLRLISPATAKTISSTFGQLDKGQVPLELSLADADARSLTDDQRVRAFNQFGEVECRVVHNPDLPAGVALIPKGLWSHNTLNGNTANALSPDCLADLGGGACFNDAAIEVEPLENGR